MLSVNKKLNCSDNVKDVEAFFKQLSIQEKVLDKSNTSALKKIKCNEIYKLILSLDNARTKHWKTIHNKQLFIKKSLCEFIKNISSEDMIQNVDMKNCRGYLMNLESSISGFFYTINFEMKNLKECEAELTKEVEMSESLTMKILRSADYKLPHKIQSFTKRLPTTNGDVQNFRDFLFRTGGHSGGWGGEEHNLFMKCWRRFSQTVGCCQRLIEAVHLSLPDVTTQDIKAHYNWLLEYRRLKELQMKALSAWKTLRRAEKHYNEERILFEAATDPENSKKQEWKKKQYAELQMNTEKSRATSTLSDKLQQRETNTKRKTGNIQLLRKKDQLHEDRRKLVLSKLGQKYQPSEKLPKPKKIPEKIAYKISFSNSTEQWRHRTEGRMSTNYPEEKYSRSVENLPKLGIPHWRRGLTVQ